MELGMHPLGYISHTIRPSANGAGIPISHKNGAGSASLTQARGGSTK